jgi:hypothetical protein
VLGWTGRLEARLQRRTRSFQETQPRQVITAPDMTAGRGVCLQSRRKLQRRRDGHCKKHGVHETRKRAAIKWTVVLRGKLFTVESVNFLTP